MSIPSHFRQWVLERPLEADRFTSDCLTLRECPMPEPAEGEALVRVRLINVHSATRWRMAKGMTKLGDTDRSNYACAQVMRSRDPTFREGDVIACQAGWQDWQIVRSADGPVGYAPPSEAVKALNRTHSQWTYVFRPELALRWSDEVLMDIFGTSGMTAWFGMRQCGPLMSGETVAVGGATGSVGSLVVQLARIAGCHVIGFARGDERRRWVCKVLGADACLDYSAADLGDQLEKLAPDGIDVASDGIGGAFTALLSRRLAREGRLFSYGGAGGYYGQRMEPPGGSGLRTAFGLTPDVEEMLAAKHARAEAWIVDAFYHERLAAEDALSALLESGELKPVNTVVEGIEQLPQAIGDLYEGPHRGKLQIRF